MDQNFEPKNETLLFFWEIIKIVVISLVIIVPIRLFIIQPFFVRGASMEPSFYNGDYLIINEIGYRFDEPERGDVVVFRFPQNRREFFIKRVIGLPGETIELSDDEIIIRNEQYPNGFVLNETSYLPNNQHTVGNLRMKLDDNEYFVLGDNRLHSSDSRTWGPVNESLIIGKALIRAWPLSRFGTFDPVRYQFVNI